MTITEMQGCLSRLYVDEAFRKLFHLDADLALEGYRLTIEESAAIRGLNRAQLDDFAASLVNKRRKRFERAYPLLFGIDGPEMAHYFARFHQIVPSSPYQDATGDIIAFGAFLEQSLVGATHLPPFASDLARYERIFFWARTTIAEGLVAGEEPASELTAQSKPRLSPNVRIAEFDYDVGTIEDALYEGVSVEKIDSGDACTIVFCPASGSAAARMLRVNKPVKTVLDLCDGRRNFDGIVAAAEKALGATDLEVSVREAILRLLQPGVITLQAVPAVAALESAAAAALTQTESM